MSLFRRRRELKSRRTLGWCSPGAAWCGTSSLPLVDSPMPVGRRGTAVVLPGKTQGVPDFRLNLSRLALFGLSADRGRVEDEADLGHRRRRFEAEPTPPRILLEAKLRRLAAGDRCLQRPSIAGCWRGIKERRPPDPGRRVALCPDASCSRVS